MYTILLYSRTLHRCEAASVGYAHAPGGRRRWRWRHGSWLETPAASNLRAHRRARWRAPPRGTQRRTRHRRQTTVSSTSSFCRRRRRRRRHRRLLGRQAAGRGTTFGAGCAARHAASAPSPPHHLQSTRAHSDSGLSAIGWSLHGREQARLGSPSAAPP